MTLLKSWVESANSATADFPLNNLPYGVFSIDDGDPRCGVAIGDSVLDVAALETAGLLSITESPLCQHAAWNPLMGEGPTTWAHFRQRLTELLAIDATERHQVEPHLYPLHTARLHMPVVIIEFTDFYAGRHHATNVGTMFRGAENALPPNWLHMPIGYNGRASSVVVSGTPVRRPWGQLKSPDHDQPAFMPSRRFDMELEMGALVGTSSNSPLSVDEADAMIFGYVLLNDWSARDIQAWEYQPLGPFQAKATATTISPWIVTAAALNSFRVSTPMREVKLLPHLSDTGPMLYDIELEVTLAPHGKSGTTITRTNYREMYYSAAQQLAHHASSGCPMRSGDLIGSGTISGPEKHMRGSLLELSWGGKEPLTLDTGESRSFLEDGDTLTLHGHARGKGFTIGFGDCSGTLLPALDDPCDRNISS
jgi:fumarylacetoacetase